MHKKILWMLFSLASIFLIAVCGSKRTSITAAGSTAFQPFAEKLAEQYMSHHPDISITVQGGGSAVGIQSALSGAAHIGMADLVQLPQEANALQATIVARDGIVIVVHPANTIADLTTDQIRDIFSGKIKNWQELSGTTAAITVVSREAGSGTRISFEQIIQNLALTRDAIIQDSNGAIRETVANDPNAIGYLSHGLINERIKAQTIDGIACSNTAIQNGQYKLSRPIYLLTKGAPVAAVTGFIDYILSPEGQQTLASSGLIPAK